MASWKPIHMQSWSGFLPVLVLTVDHETLGKRLGLEFARGFDDLDDTFEAGIRTDQGRDVAFIQHRGAPDRALQILVQRVATDSARTIVQLVEELGIASEEIAWIAPHLREATSTEAMPDLANPRGDSLQRVHEDVTERRYKTGGED